MIYIYYKFHAILLSGYLVMASDGKTDGHGQNNIPPLSAGITRKLRWKSKQQRSRLNTISFKRLIIYLNRYDESFKRDLCCFDFRSNFLVFISILVNIRGRRGDKSFFFNVFSVFLVFISSLAFLFSFPFYHTSFKRHNMAFKLYTCNMSFNRDICCFDVNSHFLVSFSFLINIGKEMSLPEFRNIPDEGSTSSKTLNT